MMIKKPRFLVEIYRRKKLLPLVGGEVEILRILRVDAVNWGLCQCIGTLCVFFLRVNGRPY